MQKLTNFCQRSVRSNGQEMGVNPTPPTATADKNLRVWWYAHSDCLTTADHPVNSIIQLSRSLSTTKSASAGSAAVVTAFRERHPAAVCSRSCPGIFPVPFSCDSVSSQFPFRNSHHAMMIRRMAIAKQIKLNNSIQSLRLP